MAQFLTWIAIKKFLKKASAFCKKYWQILLGISIPIILSLIFRKRKDLSGVLNRVNEDYKKEIDTINSTYEIEIKKREDVQKKYLETIDEIEKRYSEKNEKLSSQKKKEIKKLVEENTDSPESLASKISELTGFEIVVK